MKIPILRLGTVLLTSIQVDLTDEDILQFQHDVLVSIKRHEAQGIVIDITSLEIVDSFMARAINETANMARLLGAEVVVCGIQPAVAMTLVEMGRGLIGVKAAFNLEQGLHEVRRLIAVRQQPTVDPSSDERP